MLRSQSPYARSPHIVVIDRYRGRRWGTFSVESEESYGCYIDLVHHGSVEPRWHREWQNGIERLMTRSPKKLWGHCAVLKAKVSVLRQLGRHYRLKYQVPVTLFMGQASDFASCGVDWYGRMFVLLVGSQ